MCSQRNRLRRFGIRNESSNLNLHSSVIGAMNELKICYDLLRRGFEVFRSVSPTCSCDLITMKGGKIIRVEVKTCHKSSKTGKLFFDKTKIRGDFVALVFQNEIQYQKVPFYDEEFDEPS